MIIKSIGVENYLSHRDSIVTLDTGLNIFVGKNGAGKSSILEAMLVALYGIKSNKRGKIISYGKTNCRIWVEFKHNSRIFHVERAFENKNGAERMKYAIMKINDEMAEETHNGIIERLAKELGMGQDALTNSLFIEQGQIDSLITDSPAKRKENFNEIIQLNGFEKAIRELDPLIKELGLEVKRKDTLLNESGETKEKISTAKNELKSIETVILGKEKKFNDENAEFEKIKAEVTRMEQVQKEVEKLKNSLKERRDRIGKLEREIIDLKARISQSDALKLKKTELAGKTEYVSRENLLTAISKMREIEVAKENLERNKKAKDDYNKRVEAKTRMEEELKPYLVQKLEMEKLEGEIDSLRKGNEEAIGIIQGEKSNQETLKKKKDELNEIEKTLPPEILNMDLSKIPEKINELQTEIERISNEMENDSGIIAKGNGILSDLEEKISRLRDASVCPLCGHELEVHDHEEMMKNFLKQKEENEELVLERNAHRKALDIKKKKIDDSLKNMNSSLTHRYISALENIKTLENELSGMSGKIREAVEIHEKYDLKLNKFQTMKKSSSLWEQKENDLRKVEGILSATDINELKKEIESKIQELEKLNNSLESLGEGAKLARNGVTYDSVTRIEKEIREIDEKLAGMDVFVQQIAAKDAERSSLEQELKNESTSLAEKEESIKGLDSLKADSINYERRVSDLRKELEKSRIDRGRNQSLIEEWEVNLCKIQEEIEGITKKENAYNFLAELKRIFGKDGIPRYLRDIAVQSITSRARSIVARFNLSIEDIRIAEDLSITITQEGNTKEVSQLSGGERVAVAIALRLAISKYLGSNINTVIMDEPTIYLDDERKNEFRDIIQGSQKELSHDGTFPQMIVITHDQELYDGADIAYEVTKSDGVSKVEDKFNTPLNH